jgi:hypothetical protein
MGDEHHHGHHFHLPEHHIRLPVRDIGEIPSTICQIGSEGGFFLPLFGNEFELGWPYGLRPLLYFFGLVSLAGLTNVS